MSFISFFISFIFTTKTVPSWKHLTKFSYFEHVARFELAVVWFCRPVVLTTRPHVHILRSGRDSDPQLPPSYNWGAFPFLKLPPHLYPRPESNWHLMIRSHVLSSVELRGHFVVPMRIERISQASETYVLSVELWDRPNNWTIARILSFKPVIKLFVLPWRQ